MVISDLRIKLFADISDTFGVLNRFDPIIKGFTTNPSLMKKAGITNYEKYAKVILENSGGLPVSFEVFADEPDEMMRQARIISSWGNNIYVKIPVTDTKGRFMGGVINDLSHNGIKLNVTAVMTMQQVMSIFDIISPDVNSIISVFAGRIADTGINPEHLMGAAAGYLAGSKTFLLWASCREILNIFQADDCGCDIITVPVEILAKLPLIGKDLNEYSLETVRQFHRDAEGLSL